MKRWFCQIQSLIGDEKAFNISYQQSVVDDPGKLSSKESRKLFIGRDLTFLRDNHSLDYWFHWEHPY